jgi:UDP-N-acetylmuramate dehydrogenase
MMKSRGAEALCKKGVPIAEVTTFKNLGSIADLVVLESVADAKDFLRSNKNFYILGKGSNVLLNPDTEIRSFVQLSAQILPVLSKRLELRINAGLDISAVLALAKKKGLGGMEFAAGVPASLGGMVYMNFSCFGKSMADFVQKVRVLDEEGQDFWLENKDLDYGYRKSIFQHKPWLILEVVLKLVEKKEKEIEEEICFFVQKRKAVQPLGSKTFGSIFKNPQGKFAGEILERLGYKGYQYGQAKISEKHANFMINLGQAQFKEACFIIDKIKFEVKKQEGIELELEVEVI